MSLPISERSGPSGHPSLPKVQRSSCEFDGVNWGRKRTTGRLFSDKPTSSNTEVSIAQRQMSRKDFRSHFASPLSRQSRNQTRRIVVRCEFSVVRSHARGFATRPRRIQDSEFQIPDSRFQIPNSWADSEIAPKAREHWLKPIWSKIFCQQRQAINYKGTRAVLSLL